MNFPACLIVLLCCLLSGPRTTAQIAPVFGSAAAYGTPSAAANIGYDVALVVRLADVAAAVPPGKENPALDTIVTVLAYYAGAPDTIRIRELFNGPALLTHYAGNRPVREFLAGRQLDVLLQAYAPPPGLRLPAGLRAPTRLAFLRQLPGAELFSREGKIDLGLIRSTIAAPDAPLQNLKAAASAASSGPGFSTAQLVSNALAGLSDWISRRAQEELTYTFLTRLQEDIQRNGLDHLFPATSAFLPQLDLLNYKAILPTIRKAFVEDLQTLAFSLGNFLDARQPNSFRQPMVYNVFLLYRILDLDMRGVSMPDILGYVYGELKRTRIDVRRQIDTRMAKIETVSPEFVAVQRAFDRVAATTDSLNGRFRKALDRLSDDQYDKTFNALDAARDRGLGEEDYYALFDQIDGVYGPVNDATLPLKSNYWEEDTPRAPAAGIVSSWLRGEEAYAYYEAYPSLTRYDQYFGPDAVRLSPDQLRAAGLTAAREVLAQATELPKYETLWQQLLDANDALTSIRAQVQQKQNARSVAEKDVSTLLEELRADLATETAFRPDPALAMLTKLVEEITPSAPQARQRTLAVRERLRAFVLNSGRGGSPLAKRMGPRERTSTYFPPVQKSIDEVAQAYKNLEETLLAYSAQRADSLVVQFHNLTTFETIFGMAQQVFFLLADGNGAQPFAPRAAIGSIYTNAAARDLFAGLAQDRLRLVPGLGQLSTPGLTTFLLDFAQYLGDFASDDIAVYYGTNVSPEVSRRIATVDFIAKTLESLLSAPILQVRGGTGEARSLAQRFPAFAEVPAVAHQVNELFQLTQKGQYRYAVSNLLELVRLFDLAPPASRKERRLKERQRTLLAQINSHVVKEEAPELTRLGLALPDGHDLPAPTENRDAERMAGYRATISTAGANSPDGRDATDAIRTLKIKRLQEQLARVGDRLERFDSTRTDNYHNKLFRYGTFMADVAAANNPQDFETALNSVALPVGSSQIKRTRPSSFELGAYFGAALSGEQLILPEGVDAPELEETTLTASLFVPVGVSYSFNVGGSKSVTLFGSLLDLGALTAFRLEDRNDADGAKVERLPEFWLSNVISPGFHLMYNFPKSPITLGVGVQDGPNVRKFSLAGETQQRNARGVRGMVSLSVDVPIFRFFNN